MSSVSQFAAAHLHTIGGNIHLDYRWGWAHRKRPLEPNQVRAIRNSTKTVAELAEEYHMTPGGIRSVISRHRYRDVPDLSEGEQEEKTKGKDS